MALPRILHISRVVLAVTITNCTEKASLRTDEGAASTDSTRPPLDLVMSKGDIDPNGLLFNPKWKSQTDSAPDQVPDVDKECGAITSTSLDASGSGRDLHFGIPDCTGQNSLVTFNQTSGLKRLFWFLCHQASGAAVHGHINWVIVTVSGQIHWEGYALDGDYDLQLTSARGYGRTKGNKRALALEFSGDETAYRMNIPKHNGDWWSRWVTAVWNIGATGPIGVASPEKVTDVITGRQQAIVTGLLGLDGVHGWPAEIHPVLGLAINVHRTKDDDVWLMMVRNMGDEGMCSSHKVPFQLDLGPSSEMFSYTFEIPWFHEQADSVTVDWNNPLSPKSSHFTSNSTAVKGPMLRSYRSPRRALWVTFDLPKPKSEALYALVYGELHLKWHGARVPQTAAPLVASSAESEPIQEDEDTPEALLGRMLDSVPRSRRRALSALGAPSGNLLPSDITPTHDDVVRIMDSIPQVVRVPDKPQSYLDSREKEKRDAQRSKVFCQELGESRPGCKGT